MDTGNSDADWPSALKFMGGFYAMRGSEPLLRAQTMSVGPSPHTRLSDDEIDALADLVDLIDGRTDVPVSLEGLDGFITALACSPRTIPAEEYFPVLFVRDDGLDAIFEDEADMVRFLALFDRRRNEIARALAAPIED